MFLRKYKLTFFVYFVLVKLLRTFWGRTSLSGGPLYQRPSLSGQTVLGLFVRACTLMHAARSSLALAPVCQARARKNCCGRKLFSIFTDIRIQINPGFVQLKSMFGLNTFLTHQNSTLNFLMVHLLVFWRFSRRNTSRKKIMSEKMVFFLTYCLQYIPLQGLSFPALISTRASVLIFPVLGKSHVHKIFSVEPFGVKKLRLFGLCSMYAKTDAKYRRTR